MRHSINAKLSVYFIVVVTLILGTFGTYNYKLLSTELEYTLKRDSKSLTERLAQSLPDPIWNYSVNTLQQIVDSEINSESVLGIFVWAENGELIIGKARNPVGIMEATKSPPKDAAFIQEEPLIYKGSTETKVGKLYVYIDDTSVVKGLRSALLREMLQILILDIILVVFQSVMFSRIVGRPLRAVTEAVKGIAQGKGDLRQRLQTTNQDELGELSEWFNQFLGGMQKLITDIVACSQALGKTSHESASLVEQSKGDLERQRTEMALLATAVNKMAVSAQEVAKNAEQAAASTLNAREESSHGKQVVDKTVGNIHSLAQEVQNTTQVIHELESRANHIGTILDVIRGIAEQTNLLALNAAIEAARAGEQGRGFAVVADEVRTLAQRTQQSIAEIQEMITQLQTGAKKAVMVMEQGCKQAESSVGQAKIAGDSLEKIATAVSRIADMTTHIATAAEEQYKVTGTIDRNILSVSDVINGTVKVTQQSAAGAEQLKTLAQHLQSLVTMFKV